MQNKKNLEKKIIWGMGILMIVILVVSIILVNNIVRQNTIINKLRIDSIKDSNALTGAIVNNNPNEKIQTPQQTEEQNQDYQTIKVSKVIDGDTIQLLTGKNVRLIGINAPEVGEKCSLEATDKLREFVLGKEVKLENDIEDKDQYNRLLRYVYINNAFINLELVKLGFAHKYEYGSNIKYSSEFEEAENKAKENCGCIWQPCSSISDNIPNYIKNQCFIVTDFHFNAVGDDNSNLNDEYVTLKNNCNYQIEMTNWTIKDETASHIYYLPNFSVEAGNSVTLYTGKGTNTFISEGDKLYWGREEGNYAAIWNNDGDTLFLRDTDGNLVLSENYGGYN